MKRLNLSIKMTQIIHTVFFLINQRFPFYHCGGAYYLAVRQADRPTDRLIDRSTDQNRTDQEGRLTSNNVCRVEGKEKVWDKKKCAFATKRLQRRENQR